MPRVKLKQTSNLFHLNTPFTQRLINTGRNFYRSVAQQLCLFGA